MLTVKNLRKEFHGTQILKGISLEVEKGDVVAILGPSGAGKTTLLRCLNFLERADGGEMVFDGQYFQLDRISRKEIAGIRKKTAFVFQDFNLFSNKTALENVTEGLIIARKMPKAQAIFGPSGLLSGPAFRRPAAKGGYRPGSGHGSGDHLL